MRRLLAPAFLYVLAAGQAYGWGCEGHAIVALIARAHLTPAASEAVDRILRQHPIDPELKRFCQNLPADLMVESASWPDDVRTAERNGHWHYVDIPLTVSSGTKLDEWCPPIGPSENGKDRPGCVTNALESEASILRDRKAAPADRATAVRYLIHFTGDLHQPLHDSDNDDQGGNCTAMRFLDEEKPVKLHGVWDYKILAHQLAAKHQSITEYAAALDLQFSAHAHDWAGGKPQEWAWEGHDIAIKSTYGKLNPNIPFVKTPKSNCDAQTEAVSALHIAIGDEYVSQNAAVIDEQLAKAGYRLAAILNSIL